MILICVFLIQSGDVVWRVDGEVVAVEGDEQGDTEAAKKEEDDDGDNDGVEGAEEEEGEEECFLCGDQATCILQEQVQLLEIDLLFSK